VLSSDRAHRREWRSETLTALASHPEFKDIQLEYGKTCTDELAQLLANLVPNLNENVLKESVWKSMIKPSMDLAHELQLSPSIFLVDWTPSNELGEAPEFEAMTCVDLLENGKILEASDGRDGRKKIYLFDICPGLYYKRVKENTIAPPRTLCKPTVLIAATEGREFPLRNGATLLGWLDNEVKRSKAQLEVTRDSI
jgi:hypothetical protein